MRRSSPILEYIHSGNYFRAVRVRTRDTSLPFGPGSLDHMARTFIGLPKSDALTAADKEDMVRTFQQRPIDAFAYAATDAVTTLLIHEKMESTDRALFRGLGVPEESIPPFHATGGARVAAVLEATTRTGVAVGSAELASRSSVRELMLRGGAGLLDGDPDASRFGIRTASVHGGLLFNRSPTKLWHASPGMLADVDMSSCYGAITSRMDVY